MKSIVCSKCKTEFKLHPSLSLVMCKSCGVKYLMGAVEEMYSVTERRPELSLVDTYFADKVKLFVSILPKLYNTDPDFDPTKDLEELSAVFSIIKLLG